MNNEPVAWRTHYPSGWEYKDGNPPFELKGNSQLLYTHPVKELTDEEKWKLWGECPNGLVYDRVMLFADLVIRKAQEK